MRLPPCIVVWLWWAWVRVPGVCRVAIRRRRTRQLAELRIALHHLHPEDVDNWIRLYVRQQLDREIEAGHG